MDIADEYLDIRARGYTAGATGTGRAGAGCPDILPNAGVQMARMSPRPR
ncbi:hypothetical protein ACFYWS_25290 [Streptomyces sp. NPDC002795]